MLTTGLMSSNTNLWATPKAFFAMMDEEFHFELDVCATAENAKCKRFYTAADDGLSKAWHGMCWMNPPYGREIGKWVKKAYESALGGGLHGGLPAPRADGYAVVPGLLPEIARHPVHPWTATFQ